MRIAVISGSRADRGATGPVVDALLAKGVEARWYQGGWDGQPNNKETSKRVAIRIDDTDVLLRDFKPDLIVLCGDRYEIFGSAVGVFLAGYPIAHLSGGDITEGSQDDSMRHAITKLAHLHFVTNEESKRRVIQMGEEPWRVFNVGCPAIDNLKSTIAYPPNAPPFILVVWHPNTLEPDKTIYELESLQRALSPTRINKIIIGPNGDAGNELINNSWEEFARTTSNVAYVKTLERQEFLNLLANAAILVGNSSAGFYEAPSFNTPVLNIGDRQKGRMLPANVMSCESFDDKAISHCIESMLCAGRPKVNVPNPYGDGQASERIAEVLVTIEPKKLLRKKWHDCI